MTTGQPVIEPFGDAALLVCFEPRIEVEINAAVHRLAAAVRADRAAGAPWNAPVAAYASLLVPYDPLLLGADEARARLAALAGAADTADEPSSVDTQPVEIAVRYGGPDGPDLAAVAERCSLTEAEFIEIHSAPVYRCYFLGFAPGFAYLGTLPEALQLPRRDTPRPRVPAGSVAIAGRQTAVYPLSSPGGWHLIGRTDARIWDIERQPPQLISAGASVRFIPSAG
jgi:KipI family sensor histidine kinase inhibitor